MGLFQFNLGPTLGNRSYDSTLWRGGTLFLWGRYTSDPAGTRFHFKVVPLQLPESLIAAGKSPSVVWLYMLWGEGTEIRALAEGWTSPALEVPDPQNPDDGGGWAPQLFGAGEDGPPWAAGLDTQNGGVPVPGDGWDWAIGAGLNICYPFDWLSPTPSLDEFKFKVEVWSSKQIPNPQDPGGDPLNVEDQFLYTLLDTGMGKIDHPCMQATGHANAKLWLCPGMQGTVRMVAEIPQMWTDVDPNPMP